jgi:hypothetical protein
MNIREGLRRICIALRAFGCAAIAYAVIAAVYLYNRLGSTEAVVVVVMPAVVTAVVAFLLAYVVAGFMRE